MSSTGGFTDNIFLGMVPLLQCHLSRIQTDVLSITAQEILTLQRGVQVRKFGRIVAPGRKESTCAFFHNLNQAGMASIVFEETEIVLNPTCALFVTMEAPRAIQRKIPDNFKVVT